MAKATDDLTGLCNIGPTVARKLREVGIQCREDLKRVGAADVYRRLVARSPGKTVPVCYYLYSLQGALDGVHWDLLSARVKQQLLRAVGRA